MGKIVNQDLPADPPAPSAGNHVIYTKAGGVFVRSPSGVVGPLSAGGTVNNLQDAYDGGASIATTVAGGAVSISSTLPSGPDALAVTVGGSTNATGVLVTNSGPGAAVVATALGSGNAVEVESSNNRALNVKVNGNGLNARGLAVDLTASGSAGTGIDVSMNSSGSGVSIQQAGTGNGIDVEVQDSVGLSVGVFGGAATAKGIEVLLTDFGSGAAGSGLTVEVDGTGPAAVLQQFGTGNALTVEVSSSATTVAGAHIEFTDPSNTGPGILVENDPASTSKFVGIQVQAATGTGGSAIIARNLGSGSSIYAQKTGTGSEPVVEIASSNPAATGAGVEINVNSSPGAPGQVIRIDPAATANAIEVRNPAAVFTVDRDGDTTTPSVTFNGGGTVTVRGDTGTPGDPINPRIELTSGSTSVGRVARVHSGSVKNGAASVDVELAAGGQFSDFRNEQPTFVGWQNSGAPGQVVYLPSATRYPVGTELILWCLPSGSSIVVTDFGVAGQQIKDTTGASATQNMIAGSARKFLSIGTSGWILSGVF